MGLLLLAIIIIILLVLLLLLLFKLFAGKLFLIVLWIVVSLGYSALEIPGCSLLLLLLLLI